MKRIEDSHRDLWDNIKSTNIKIIGVPEEEGKKKGSEIIFEDIIMENFSNIGKEIVTQVQEAQRVPYRINPRRNTPRYKAKQLTGELCAGRSRPEPRSDGHGPRLPQRRLES